MSKQDLSSRRSNLSETKRALLEKLLRGKPASAVDTVSIPRRLQQDRAPLSFSQQRLWFLDQLVPGNPFYIIPAVVRLTGALDVAALEQSLNRIITRHEILRTSFVMIDAQPTQAIAPALTFEIPVTDLSQFDDREEQALKLAAREAQQPFDMRQAPLMRAKLLRLSEDEHILLLMMHHIISDEWSIGILLREIGILYKAFKTASAPALPDLPAQYGDFAIWQQNRIQGEALEKQLSYWKQQLEGIPPVLELPADKPRPAAQSFRGGKQWLSLSSDLGESLKQLSDQQGATLFMTLLGAFATLLHRYTGQRDIALGSPIANRNQKEVESLIGCFINTLVLRTDLSGNPTFVDLLGRVKEVALGAYANQDLPFEKLVEQLQPERDLSRTPLFNAMLVFQNVPMPSLELPGLDLKLIDVHNDTAKLDLVLSINETATGLVGYFEYSKDLFGDATISRMISHFQILLEAIVCDPHQPVSTLPLLAADERQTLIDWNNTNNDFPRDERIHQLFEAQVERAPQAIALVREQQRLTYQELNQRANQLARYLRAEGVGPEVLVALCAERSVEMVVGILGILKAGGAYVPLDPEYPQARLAFMLEDTQAPLLLTQEHLLGKLPEHKATVICLDTDWEKVARESGENIAGGAEARNLAYVIYTSGSTGRPKGVLVEHRGVCNMARAESQLIGWRSENRILQFSSVSFDASVLEIVTAFLNGAGLYLAQREAGLGGMPLINQLRDQAISVVVMPPSLLAALPDEPLPDLHTIFAVGEACPREVAARWNTGRRFLNAYGPTETSVIASTAHCADGARKPSIGKPPANTQIYLTDDNLALVPIGISGEILIGGLGVTRGYLNRPDLTAEKFIPDPFSKEPGARLYKSGDWARYLPTGEIDFIGRLDHQVKIRGFRVEPGEIETALAAHAAVRDAVVMAREDARSDKRLVAYIVIKDDETITTSEIRAYLKEKMPDYMVPSVFVMMDRMPMTMSGKIDRRALPAPDSARPELSQAFVPPADRKQKLLADIWAEILGLKQVGIHDNFFELGGDSILSIQVVAKANQAGLRLTPRLLFQHQTIAELSAAATATEAVKAEQEILSGDVMLTPIQRWFFEQDLADPHHFNQAVLLEARRALETVALSEALKQLINHHDGLRLRFNRRDGRWQQANAKAETHQLLSRIDLSHLNEEQRSAALNKAASDAQSSLNIAEGPLLQAALFIMGGDKPARLLIVIHHLAVDGVSWRILLEDLQTSYHQIIRGDNAQLPPKTTSFKQWAMLLNGYANSDSLIQELPYWRKLLDSKPSPLPVDFPDGINSVASAETLSAELTEQQTRALLQELPEVFRTRINEALLSALARAYSRWSGANRLLVNAEGHGREEIIEGIDLSRTVGWFTSIYPVMIESADGEGAPQSLKRVKDEIRNIPNRGIGYGVLRYLTTDERIRREMMSLPQAQISFNYLGQLDQFVSESTLFRLAEKNDSPARSPRGHRAHLIEIDCFVAQGKLNIYIAFSRNIHRRESVRQLADCFTDELIELVSQRQPQDSNHYTASDFPLAKLDQENLDRIRAAYTQIADIYPLSPMQQGMLFHSLYEPESDVYVTQMSCELTGELVFEALSWAWQQVVARHTILRTAIEWEQVEEPLQVVVTRAELKIERQDWRRMDTDEQRRLLEDHLREGRIKGFDFRQPPLMRVALMRIADNKYYFVWEHHHLLLDGWSTAALIEEVFSLYESKMRGEQVKLNKRRPYRDYIEWVTRQDQSRAQRYWQRELGGVDSATMLGVEISGSNHSRQGYTQQALKLSEPQSEKLSRFARQQQITLNTILQGCWAVLMSRYSQQREVVYGVTVSGRGMALEGVEQMIGLMINTLPARVEVSDPEPVGKWLRAIQQKQVGQREYEYSSLWQVQGWSGVEAGERLFESIVVFENYPVEAGLRQHLEKGARLEVSNVQSAEETNYGLTVAVLPGKEISIEIGYEKQRYDEATIRRMLRHMEVLLGAMAADPHQSLSLLPLMSDSERRQLLVGFNHTSRPFPADRCVHHLVERRVEQSPSAIAVIDGDLHTSYKELNLSANRLAHFLRSMSVAPEQVVAFCFDSSLDMVISMLAISKSGAAYLPLDPSNPPNRLAFMIEDSNARLIITLRRFLHLLPDRINTVCLDSDSDLLSAQNDFNLDNIASSRNALYIVHTSGSTGSPKGIVVEHRSMVNEALAFISHHGLQPGDRLLHFASVGFDVTAEEVFSSLISGTAVVVGLQKSLLGVDQLLDYCKLHHLSVLNLPSTYWHEWVSQMSLGQMSLPSSLRLVVVGNERVSADRFQLWLAHVGNRIEWKNAYGPTEATVTTTIFRAADSDQSMRNVPIGRPIANAEIYVLDREMNPMPIGVGGELYIAGAGLARGYLNRAELTAESFLAHPYGNEPGARLYRTGDLARFLEDGQIEFIGRRDEQVKVRGYRVELGEIESALAQHSGVREVAVVARENNANHLRLVGYAVVEEQSITVEELKKYLAERLPVYMQPSTIIILDEMPKTPTGKLDRKRLPQVDWSGEGKTERREAETAKQRQMQMVWRDVLGVEQIGIDDNFFELGGDSILCLQVVARARRAGLMITPKQVFEHPTIAELVLMASSATLVEAEQGPVTGEVFLTPIQRWMFEQELGDRNHYNQALMFEANSQIKTEDLRAVVNKIVEHHDALRMRYRQEAGVWKQEVIKEQPDEIVEEVDLTAVSEQQESAAIEEAAERIQRSLDIERGPMMRVGVMEVGKSGRKLILMVIHHLVVDGVSWRVLLEDIGRGLEQVKRGEDVRFEAKSTSFKQWAERLARRARSAELLKESGYWLNENMRQVNPLPVDCKAGVNDEKSAQVVIAGLDEKETRALLQEVPKVYRTQIDEVLMAGLAEAFRTWTGAGKMLIDIEGHGREEIFNDIDLTRTVGWFTTLYPVFLDIGETNKTGEAIKRVKQQMRAIPGKGIGYGMLRYLADDAQIEQELSRMPEAEVSFNYLGQTDQVLNRNAYFRMANESAGHVVSPKAKRKYLIDINAQIEGGRLNVYWSYSENTHQRETIERLAEDYIQALRRIIIQQSLRQMIIQQSPESAGYSPTDFPLAKLNQEELTQLEKDYQQIEDIYPLSPMQEGMLFHSLCSPGSYLYFEQFSCRLQGALDIAAFKQAWQEVINRFSILRTACVWEHRSKPLQIILEQLSLPCDQQDWRSLSPAEQQRQLENYLEADRSRGFALSKAPLMRLALMQVSDDAYRFVWSHHHLLLDGWSTSVVLKEAFTLYDALRNGETASLQQPRPYRDYIAWLQQQDAAKAEEFWRQALKGISAPTPLGVDRSARAASPQGEQYKEERSQLTESMTVGLQSLARQQQLTLSTITQGAWALLLSRYSGEDEVVYGTVVSGRPAELDGAETMVGLFINTLPVRVKLAEKEPLSNWLKKLQRQQAELRQYEHSPLAAIQGWSEVERGVPLFESIVVFENYPVDETLQEGSEHLKVDDFHAEETTNYGLGVGVLPGKQMRLIIGYDCQRFDEMTIKRMLRHMETLLGAMAADPHQALSQLSFMPDSERRQVLADFNDTRREYPADRCIHQLIEQQAERTPAAVAVIDPYQQITYKELNERANRLAHFLRCLPIAPEQVVAFCLESSIDMVVCMLAISKSGAAYLPLDPANPPNRLAFMIQDSRPRLVITLDRFLHLLPYDVNTFCLDSESDTLSLHINRNLDNLASSHNALYIIYTSGSTGSPKGIVVEHRSMVNEALAMISHNGLQPGDRLLQFGSVGFDVTAEEVFSALISGAATLVGLDTSTLSIEQLLDACDAHRLSVLNLSSAYWHEWVSEMTLGQLSLPKSLRLVIVGNERASADRLQTWLALVGDTIEWKNAYGPTEATVATTIADPADPNHSFKSAPIGRPIANVEVYLLDANLNPVPIGVASELCIAGAGLARGYLNRAELTAESFLAHPYGNEPGARLYRTGDLARFLEDGQIDFVGRRDEQVKVRGFRVELAEIESALTEHPRVAEAVVVARQDPATHTRLVGYVVAEDQSLTVAELRQYLAERLPSYMQPSAIMMLEEMPKIANAKVDKRSLPEVEWAGRDDKPWRDAETSAQRQMQQIWRDVLAVDEIAIDDNFFELGGDSILTLQVVARARRSGLMITPKQVFEHPTIEEMVIVAETATEVEAEQGLVSGEVKLTPVQRWMFEQELEDRNHYNQSVMLEADSRIKVEEVREVVNRIVEHHDALRMRYKQEEGVWKQEVIEEGREQIVERIDLTNANEQQQQAAIKEAGRRIQRSLDIERGPMMRVGVMEVGREGRKLILMVIHHLVVDGVSWRVILEDMAKGLEQVKRGTEVSFEAKSTSFKQWSLLLNDYANSDTLIQELPYWLNLFDSQAQPLPVDFPDGINSVASADILSCELSSNQTRALLQQLPEAFRTRIDEVLLSALAHAYRTWSRAAQLLVDVEGHGREPIIEGIDLSRTVGWFTSIYPVMIESLEAEAATETLKRVKEALRKIPNRGIGYGVLRYLTTDERIRREMMSLPQAQISFNYLGQTDRAVEQGGLFRLSHESAGEDSSPAGKQKYLIEVNAIVEEGKLRADWSYSRNLYQRSTIAAFAEAFKDALVELIAHCQSDEARARLTSDFPYSGLSQKELDDFISEISEFAD